jgi:glucose/arabinose dehydrogenase
MAWNNKLESNFFKVLIRSFTLVLFTHCSSSQEPGQKTNDPILSRIKLPPGFSITKYASGVKGARSLALGENGTLFVGTRGDKVYALVDSDGDYVADQIKIVASGLNSPNGVAFHKGDLYIGEIHRIVVLRNIESNLDNPPKPEIIYNNYPDKTHHGYKYIAIGPDDKLYAPVGAPCNVCLEDDPVFASITRMNLDGSGFEIVAHGVRNTVGFDWHPKTKKLWFTDNGRDMLGDDLPADELNRLESVGQHFGFPFCHQGDLPDPDYGTERNCSDFTPPIQKLNPHGASLGMLFYTGDMFPPEYQNQIFICEHGSWNRSKKIGYRVSMVTLQEGRSTDFKAFADGWLLPDDDILGRPVALLQMPGGSVLVSDDYSGVVYRITYKR